MNIDLNLHEYRDYLKVKNTPGGKVVFDPIRNKYVTIQPEEIVRQLFLAYLIEKNIYPRNLIQVEKSIQVNDMVKRFDIVIYDKSIHPFILIEVKSHTSKLNQSAFDQAARYNTAMKAPFLIVTNGVSTRCALVDHNEGKYVFLPALPPMKNEK